MSKVEVLCPNGRRVIVKVAPNTKLLKVLVAFSSFINWRSYMKWLTAVSNFALLSLHLWWRYD